MKIIPDLNEHCRAFKESAKTPRFTNYLFTIISVLRDGIRYSKKCKIFWMNDRKQVIPVTSYNEELSNQNYKLGGKVCLIF